MAKTVKRSKRRMWAMRLMAISMALCTAVGFGEIVVRCVGETDADGNFFFRGKHVGAVHPQVEWVREKIAEYRDSDSTRMIYDRQTGWSPRPGFQSQSGMYRYNALGIRSAPAEYAKSSAAGVWRIVLVGDSFTHGDDVPFEETWGHLLEQRLNDAGIPAEVINLGVSAYGMDQAFLRWQRIGRQFNPDLVLFGFQAENVNRNVNILRGVMALHTGIPFSKPRFRIDENGRLATVNLPTMPIDAVPEIMADMANWKDAQYEWFYDPDNFQQRFWHGSRLLSLTVDRFRGKKATDTFTPARPTLPPDSEPAQITQQILKEFREDVNSLGGEFRIVHLPKKSDLKRTTVPNGKALKYEALLERIEKTLPIIDPFNTMYDVAIKGDRELDSLFAKNKRHYSLLGNQIVAKTVAESLIKEKRRSKK